MGSSPTSATTRTRGCLLDPTGGILPAVASLVNGYLGRRAQQKSEDKNWDHQKALIYNALANLTPEHIQMLSRMFLPMIQSGNALQSQTALHGLQRMQARSGLAGSRIGASQMLGFQANQGNSALQQAFQQAFGLAGQQAGVWTGQPVIQNPPNYNMANAFQDAVRTGLLGYSLTKQKNQQPATDLGSPLPSNVPDPGYWGLPPNQVIW